MLISVVIPTLDAESRLPACLDALVPASIAGLVQEVIVVDGGSVDATTIIADGFGARILVSEPGRGGQLRIGADAARGDWLLFLHADTVLSEHWRTEAAAFIQTSPDKAAVFTLRFDTSGLAPNLVASGGMVRTRLLKRPYGDQGLLISTALYQSIGGFRDFPLMEDVDFMKRLTRRYGRDVLHVFQSEALTSADRYEREGYVRRVFRNAVLLARFQMGASPEQLALDYGK
ncbi:MAG: TIGR04283 family arsenosugar biosynthesis glycosyltransferase [Pseudomonadota bacterium]